MSIADLIADHAALSALRKALAALAEPEQPTAQTPPKAGDDGAAEGEDEDPLATAIAAVDEAAEAVVGLMADIEGDQDDGS